MVMTALRILGGLLALMPCIGVLLLWRAERKSGPKLVKPPAPACPVSQPAIVAGADLVWADRRDMEQVAAQFAAIASGMADLDALDALAEFYLLPEVTQ